MIPTSSTVDGRPPAPVEVGSLYHYLPGFIHPKGGWPAGISGCHQRVRMDPY